MIEEAARRGYTNHDLNEAIRHYEFCKQYGERIEIGDFFANEPQKMLTYKEVEEICHLTSHEFTDFDGYKARGSTKVLWCIHSHAPHSFDGLQRVVCAGQEVKQPKQLQKVANE